jgi:two-component sensor histidine kinase
MIQGQRKVNSNVTVLATCTNLKIMSHHITITVQVQDITLNVDTAIPLGIITNELITNAFKYAYPGEMKGEIFILFSKEQELYTLTIKDHGIGLPPNYDFKSANSLGFQIVSALVGQIGGEFNIISNQGTEVKVSFTERSRGNGKKKNSDS